MTKKKMANTFASKRIEIKENLQMESQNLKTEWNKVKGTMAIAGLGLITLTIIGSIWAASPKKVAPLNEEEKKQLEALFKKQQNAEGEVSWLQKLKSSIIEYSLKVVQQELSNILTQVLNRNGSEPTTDDIK